MYRTPPSWFVRRAVGASTLIGIVTACAGCGDAAPDTGTDTGTDTASDSGPASFESAVYSVGGPTAYSEEAVARGVDFVMDSGDDGGPKLFPEIMPGGVALFDADGDRDLDLYFVQFGPIDPQREGQRRNRLYLNRGDGSFADRTEGSGAADAGLGCGVATGDYDGDGDVDLYVTNLGRNTLLRNDGEGRFVDVTDASGTGDTGWGASAAFLDYDLDGDRDLFVTNYIVWSEDGEIECRNTSGRHDYCSPKAYDARSADVLFRNEGDGTFTDVSGLLGIDGSQGNGLGVVWADFDEDGRPDIFVANDGNPNHFFLGTDAGGFDEAAKARGVYLAEDGNTRAGMGVVSADPDNDGDLDILIVNLMNQFDTFFRNEGGYFVDDTASTGLTTITKKTTRFGVGFLDIDNDGRLDLFEASGRVMIRPDATDKKRDPFVEPNHLLQMNERGRYVRIPPLAAWGDKQRFTSRGAAFGDLDGDGGVDIVVVNRDAPAQIFRNVSPRGNWVAVEVVDDVGAPALGATVRGTAGDVRFRRDVHSASSYLSATEPIARFGLGSHSALEDVSVRWPDGRELELGTLEAGRVHLIAPPSVDSTPAAPVP